MGTKPILSTLAMLEKKKKEWGEWPIYHHVDLME